MSEATIAEKLVPVSISAERTNRFEELVKSHEKQLYQFAYRLCGDHYQAQDLLQEGFYRAYKALARFEFGTAFDRWMYQILHNLYIDHYRRRKHAPPITSINEPLPYLDSEKTLEIPDWSYNPEEQAIQTELGNQIQLGLKELPAEYRTAVILCDIQGFSYEEIAQVLNCSIGTVRSRIHRGRKSLRRKLTPYLKTSEVKTV